MPNFVEKLDKLAQQTREHQETTALMRDSEIIAGIADQLKRIAKQIPSDAKADARGEGQWKGHVMGFSHYHLEDPRPLISDPDFHKHLMVEKSRSGVTIEKIKQTEAYKEIDRVCEALGLKVNLEETECENESIKQMTTMIGFLVHVSGWGTPSQET